MQTVGPEFIETGYGYQVQKSGIYRLWCKNDGSVLDGHCLSMDEVHQVPEGLVKTFDGCGLEQELDNGDFYVYYRVEA